MLLCGGAQWAESTRKNYYAKYTARIVAFFHLLINIGVLPSVLNETAKLDDALSGSSNDPDEVYYKQVRNAYVSELAEQLSPTRARRERAHP